MNQKDVITHLQIIHTWASFAREKGMLLGEKEIASIEKWTADALALLKEQEESVPLEPLCRWLSHYAACPTKTGEQPPTNIEMVRVGWEHWFRNGFKEWMKMGKPE